MYNNDPAIGGQQVKSLVENDSIDLATFLGEDAIMMWVGTYAHHPSSHQNILRPTLYDILQADYPFESLGEIKQCVIGYKLLRSNEEFPRKRVRLAELNATLGTLTHQLSKSEWQFDSQAKKFVLTSHNPREIERLFNAGQRHDRLFTKENNSTISIALDKACNLAITVMRDKKQIVPFKTEESTPILSWEVHRDLDQFVAAIAHFLQVSADQIHRSELFETAIMYLAVNAGYCPLIADDTVINNQAQFNSNGNTVSITYRSLTREQATGIMQYYSDKYPNAKATLEYTKSPQVPTIHLDYDALVKNILPSFETNRIVRNYVKKLALPALAQSAQVAPPAIPSQSLAGLHPLASVQPLLFLGASTAAPVQPKAPAKSTTVLKDNEAAVREAIQEVFAGSEGVAVRGTLVHFDYHPIDCGISLRTGLPQDENFGPGYRIKVQFAYSSEPGGYFYPENECPTLEAFINNLNTDFGMTQIKRGPQTQGLGITHFDFNKNTITFELRNGVKVTKKELDQCWDVNALTFNVTAFLEIRERAKSERGFGSQNYTEKGVALRCLPTDQPAAAQSAQQPQTVKVLGIDKAALLAKLQASPSKSCP